VVIVRAMSITVVFSVLSSILAVISIIPYYIGLWRGQLRPHFFSWVVWAILVSVACAAQIAEDGGLGAITTFLSALICTSIAVISLFRGERNITRTDWMAFIAALMAIPLWLWTENPLISVILVTCIDGLAFVPTFRKSWSKPWEESTMAYGLGALAFALSLPALTTLNVTTALYPAAVTLFNGGFCVMVLLRRRTLPVA